MALPPLVFRDPPRSLYVHVPFCRRRCGYCNFTLVAGRDDLQEGYLRAIQAEFATVEPGLELDTIFFGGGTPTQLTPARFERLVEAIFARFQPANDLEFSIEGNPEDLDEAYEATLFRLPVNRISLGVQSFRPEKLKTLEREHSPERAVEAVGRSRRAAGNVSVDLIFGTPGESLDEWQSDLQQAIGLSPDHVSTYGLTWEKGTRYWSRLLSGDLSQVEEDAEAEMYLAARRTLLEAGFEHYEVSNFAPPGRRCRHNEAYWTGKPFFGFGPGAARYIDGWRETNHRSVTTWLKKVAAGESAIAESERLPPRDAARERLVFSLRRLEGIALAGFASTTGFSVDELVEPHLSRFIDAGLFELSADRLRLTERGLLVSDAIWPYFLEARRGERAT
ncbi:MAG TPA: radical SAM family heme chaperone HemW [Pirellulaceae bacterium]|nr:radical SAM family heme chaperone HemW [Pirellulaceae bacterium]